MKQKNKELLRALFDLQPANTNLLANHLNVSVRSIKNYVREINEEYPEAIHSSREGYRLDMELAKSILDETADHIPQTSEERVIYILNQLINHHQEEAIDIYDLCDELFISLSTIKNELQKVKRRLAKYDLELVSQKDQISIKGLEKNKRKLLSTLLYNESNVNFVNLKSLQNSFLDIDIPYIKNTVLQIFEDYHYFINDYSLINLVLHITIAIDRIRKNNINTTSIDQQPAVHLHEYELAEKVAGRLEEHFHITYSKAEIYEMTLLIISRATTIDYKSINAANLEDFIGKDCLNLVKELILDINSFYYIDLSEQEFLIRFALHIKNLLVRSKNNYFSKNPLADGIKTSCPLIYDISVSLVATIKEKTGISINDDEIAYIAFHLGSALEAQKSLTEKITVALYCPSYYDMSLKVTDVIKRYYSDELLITNILTDESDFDKIKDTNLIITTIPVSVITSIPMIQISIFLNQKDRQLLNEKIETIRKLKKRSVFEGYLKELLLPDFFEVLKSGFSTEKECITYMVNKLIAHGYVDNEFENEIISRENMSSTAFGCFAIPHAMKMHAKKTGMNIVISETPISWNQQDVYLVLMLCFNKSDRYIFNEIFDPITMILSTPENVKKLCGCQSYEDFISTMSDLLQ